MNSAVAQWLLVQAFYCLHVATLTAYAIGNQGLQASLDLSSVQMGSLSGAFFMAFGVSQLLIGSQLGRYPNRWIIGGSALMATLGSLLLLVSDSFGLALAARVLMGAGAGNALVSTVRVVSERFPHRFPLVTNISQAFANLTGACIGLLVPVFPALASMRFTYHWGFLLLLVDTVLILLFSKDGNRQVHAAGGAIPTAPLSLSTRILNILVLEQHGIFRWSVRLFFDLRRELEYPVSDRGIPPESSCCTPGQQRCDFGLGRGKCCQWRHRRPLGISKACAGWRCADIREFSASGLHGSRRMDRGDLPIGVGNLDGNICPWPRVPARQCSGERHSIQWLPHGSHWMECR